MRTQQEGAICKPGRPHQGTDSVGTLLLAFPAHRAMRNKLLLFQSPVSGAFLWQPRLMGIVEVLNLQLSECLGSTVLEARSPPEGMCMFLGILGVKTLGPAGPRLEPLAVCPLGYAQGQEASEVAQGWSFPGQKSWPWDQH